MVSIYIDGSELLVKSNISILEACKFAGITIPRFCYHETLSVSGNCRMCLVEIENGEKPVAACVTEIDEGMSILIDTPFVKKARENVVETLLLNHPLDCPICDQAGECDLQDQAKSYGGNYSRFFYDKQSTEDKYCGPLIKTIMTRCITCTRCVRFGSEIAGIDFFGTLNRGQSTEIGAYISKFFKSEISGNVIDLCPVGALTSKPYAFKSRPWELRLSESIDFTDSLGSNIYINYKESQIQRIIPKSNNTLNDSIISDKTRFSYDANNFNRLTSIYTYSHKKKNFVKTDWNNFFIDFDRKLSNYPIEFIIDEKCDLESIYNIKKLANIFPTRIKISINKNKLENNNNIFVNHQNHLSNILENTQDFILLLGTNPKIESPVLNAKLRVKYSNTLLTINSSGLNFGYNINTKFINLGINNILESIEGKNKIISKEIINAKNPLIIFGENFEKRITNKETFITIVKKNIPNIKTLNIFNKCNTQGINFLNINNTSLKLKDNKKTIFIINKDDSISNRSFLKTFKKCKSIWINSHGSNLALKSNYILPMATPFEDEQIYFNLESRPQKTSTIFNPNDATKSLKSIIESTFNIDFKKLENKSYLQFIESFLNNSQNYDLYKTTQFPVNNFELNNFISSFRVNNYPIFQKIKNFYGTDTFTRNSIILRNCTKENLKNFNNFS